MPQAETAKRKMPVTPKMVTWARERTRYPLQEAEKYFKKIAEWEEGTSSPSYPQLEAMADKFKCPIAVFFFPEPPTIESERESFRTLTEEEFNLIPREVRSLLRKARAMQLNLSELNDGRNPANRLITRDLEFKISGSIDDMAAMVRGYLEVPIEEQYQWPTVEDAFEHWRKILSDVGIFIFKDAFKQKNYSGFCLYDDEFPVIYVNNTTAKSRQIFTVFHELAHLIFHTSGIDVIDDDYIDTLPEAAKKIEIICNRFSGRFLVPEADFETVASEYPATRETAALLADRFCVSRAVIYRKFLDRDLIDQQEYAEATKLWAEQGGSSGSGGNYYYTQMAYLGPQYIALAFQRYYQNRFDEIQLAEYLNIKPKNVPKFEETYVRVSA